MDIKLQRAQFRKDGIFGKFIDPNSIFVCFTLEHAFIQLDGTYLPIIPSGTYKCVRRLSPHFGYEVFMLIGVPGHDYVEIHIGNFNKDSIGCILLGETLDTETDGTCIIGESKDAFQTFMARQAGVDEFQLTVE